jgi:hypothetical protein
MLLHQEAQAMAVERWQTRWLAVVWVGWLALGIAVTLWRGRASGGWVFDGPSLTRPLLFLIPPAMLTTIWLIRRSRG